MSLLFEPLTLRSVRFRNRAWMSPICQYSAQGDAWPQPYQRARAG